MYPVSLITIQYKREGHLRNLLRGLAQGNVLPAEVIVISMGSRPHLTETYPFNIISCVIPAEDPGALPIARARNLGAEQASYPNLFFLDVDCIPDENYISTLYDHLERHRDGLIMGTPRYLRHPVAPDFNQADLFRDSTFHPARPRVANVQEEQTYELFWSLCFAMDKSLFERMDGFDENYIGYGGEDTDFAFRLRKKQIPFYLSRAVAYHQQHAFYAPPLKNLHSIVHNCNFFYERWGTWAMDKHLEGFRQLGLIDWAPEKAGRINVLADPSPESIESAYVADRPYA